MSTSSTINNLYQDSASFGKSYAVVSAIIVSLLALISFVIGMVELFKKNTHDKSIVATVLSATCTQNPSSQPIDYDCNLVLQYTVDGKQYKTPLEIAYSNISYKINDSIKILYNSSDPTDIVPGDTINPKTLGWILIIVGVVVLAMAWLTVYLTRKSKFFAAAAGASGAYHMLF